MQWCVHCEGQNLTELQPSTCRNPELRASNRIQPSRLGLIPPQLASTSASASTHLNLCCWASLVEGWGWGHQLGLVGLKVVVVVVGTNLYNCRNLPIKANIKTIPSSLVKYIYLSVRCYFPLLEPLKIRNWGSYLFFFILPAFYIYETLVDWNYFRAAMLASSSRWAWRGSWMIKQESGRCQRCLLSPRSVNCSVSGGSW